MAVSKNSRLRNEPVSQNTYKVFFRRVYSTCGMETAAYSLMTSPGCDDKNVFPGVFAALDTPATFYHPFGMKFGAEVFRQKIVHGVAQRAGRIFRPSGTPE
jgi:hypothetical protein